MYRQQYSDVREVTREAGDNDVIVANLEKLEEPKEIMKEESFEGVEIDLAKQHTVKEFNSSFFYDIFFNISDTN